MAYNKLKNQYNCELYIIGGYKGDELYDYCINSGAIIKERMTHNKLLDYYNIWTNHYDLYSFLKSVIMCIVN